ncbi:hypothetical protein CF326_g7452 [Tilletia indica]|nr:hypothetical protein CF326_g7452 [Tilletia indica]
MSQTTSTSSGPADSNTLHCDSFSAQILDGNGNPMRLYGIKREGRLVEAYLEAKEDEQFQVKVEASVKNGTYAATLEIGGKWCETLVCEVDDWPVIIQGRQINEDQVETLMFCKAEVTDDELQSIREPEEVARLGEVCISLSKVSSKQEGVEIFWNDGINQEQPIYEKAKKVGAIQIGAGPTINSQNPRCCHCTYDTTFTPIDFTIRCTTRIGLQLLGHIPPNQGSENRGEEEEMEAEEKRLEKELIEVKKRRRLRNNADSSRALVSQAGEASTSRVKMERTKFDFSRGGTADDPLDIDDEAK